MKYLLLALITLMNLIPGNEATAQPRSRDNFNADWHFKLDSIGDYSNPTADVSGWRTLSLPHDWSIEGAFSDKNPATVGGGALPGGTGWYRKSFLLPESDASKKISIHFDGVYRNSEVWINGHYLGKRPNGYISFAYEMSPYLHYGNQPNVVAVKVDNSQQPNSRWYSGSGIYRNVWLVKTNDIHVANRGNFITTPKVSDKNATVHIETKFANLSGKEDAVQVSTKIYNEAGAVVADHTAQHSLVTGENKAIVSNIGITNPVLWSIEKPYLYKAVVQVKQNGQLVDEVTESFGIRYFSMDAAKGFFLNGKPVKILGVCNHHDLGCLGAAINTRSLERQLDILKKMGCNGIRTSHNPPAPELLDLCDRMGFIVMDEAFDMWKRQKNPYDYHLDWDQWYEQDLRDQVIRDRNHPSVFFWSVGNEIGEQWGDGKSQDTSGRAISRMLVDMMQDLDTTRPIVTANNEVSRTNNLILSDAFDVIGINYHHDRWKDFPAMFPGKKMIVTESVSALETRGHYDLVPMDTIRRWPEAWDKPFDKGNKDFTVSAYDHVSAPWGSTHEETWRIFKKYDHVSGMYIWTGWDYLGEPTPYLWPARSSYFGIIDLAGFPKDVYYMYQSEATNTPVLHLLPHWNWQQGDTVDVVAYYNNADEVELFLNGKSIGKRKKQKEVYHVSWRVPFQPGVLKAVSRKNGREVLTAEKRTSGKPAKLDIEADYRNMLGDGNDLNFITVKVLDANGVLVPGADNLIHFSLEGAAVLKATDNGNPISHESFLSSDKKSFNGLCLAVVQSNGKKDNVTVTAAAEGMPPVSISFLAK